MTASSFNEGWRVRPKTSIFAQIGRPDDKGGPVTLPHDALITQPRNPCGSGKNAYFPSPAVFEYTKTFAVPDDYRHRQVWLEFQGAYRDAVVFVNDQFAAHRPYGYSIFHVPLDDHLVYGADNVVRVEVRGEDDSRWYTGVGLLRDVLLHVTDPLHLAPYGVHLTHPDVDGERAVLEVAGLVVNNRRHAATATLHVQVRDAAGATVLKARRPITVPGNEDAIARQRLYLPTPHLWSPEDPYLYSVDVELREADELLDAAVLPLGIRTLKLDPVHGLRLNGETIKLRGACIHHDNGPVGGASIARAEERRIRLLKEAGFNAIRAAHTPLSGHTLDACDRLGMLVMDEAFDVWTESKSAFDYSLAFPEWWARDIDSMVLKDRNHPSVVFYSIGNEIPEAGSAGGAVWGRRLAERVRALDPSRFVTNGVNGFVATLPHVMGMMREATSAGDAGGVNDAMGSAGDMMNRISASELVSAKTEETFAVLDVAGVNYGDARYELDRELFPNRIVVGTETFPGHIDELWRLVMANPHVLGDFTWAGWDYLGEVGAGRPRYLDDNEQQFEAPYPWLTAWVGDLDLAGRRRAISFYRETVFGLRREPYIAVHNPSDYGRPVMSGGWSWPDALDSWTWSAEPGSPIRVDVYTDAEEVELLLNGRSLGHARVGDTKACIATFDLTYEPGELTAVALAGGAEHSRTSLRTAGPPARLGLHPDSVQLEHASGEMAFVQILIEDDDGAVIADDDRDLTVTVAGMGHLVGVASGRPDTEQPLTGNVCRTFHGRAVALVRPTGVGEIRLSVNGAQLASEVTLRVHPSADGRVDDAPVAAEPAFAS